MDKIVKRIERKAGIPELASILAEQLSPTDLQSLLLEVYRLRSSRLQPAAVLSDYESNRFVRPSSVSPLSLPEMGADRLFTFTTGVSADRAVTGLPAWHELCRRFDRPKLGRQHGSQYGGSLGFDQRARARMCTAAARASARRPEIVHAGPPRS